MWRKPAAIFCIIYILLTSHCLWGQNATEPNSATIAERISTDVVTIWVEPQYEVVRPGSTSALVIHLELVEDWHFYASEKTAPGGMNLKITTLAAVPTRTKVGPPILTVDFGEPIFPPSEPYYDSAINQELEVFSGTFAIYLPFNIGSLLSKDVVSLPVRIAIEGAVCSKMQCREPEFPDLVTQIKIAGDAAMDKPRFIVPTQKTPAKTTKPFEPASDIGSMWAALLLALLAGLALNIMPCVWPVLPLIVMRIVEQAKQSKGKSTTMGLAFCLGILIFFASLAGANIILKIFYGTVLQWGDQFRNPSFVIAMSLLLVVLALFMFGTFSITVPSAVAGKSGSGKGYSGAIGMGLLAAILSTPCSFGILAAAFAWAQAQPLLPATVAIMAIGIGMAIPYAVLTSTPGLLKHLPKAGRWMEIFKQAVGFILLIIAVKLIEGLPQTRRMGVLYFTVILAFCVWMWGTWVSYNTKLLRKWLTRSVAVVLVIAGGWMFLPVPTDELIDWQTYDSGVIDAALAQEKPVLIKFTADWCLSCKTVEKVVYARGNIAKLIEQKGVLAIKADTTAKDAPATLALKNIYNEPGVPVSLLFVPGRKEPMRWRGILFADELKTSLNRLADIKEDGEKNEDQS